MKTIILIAIIAVVASPIYAEEAVEAKKQDKRGVLGLGYGGYSGVSSLGYGGYASPVVGHGAAVIPATYSHAPAISYSNTHLGGYSSGYHAPIYTAPLRVGYTGYGGYGSGYTGYGGYGSYGGYGAYNNLGLGHGYNGGYVNGHYW